MELSSRWRRVLLAGVTAVFAFVGLGAWAISSPVGSAPDDDFHLASIWCSWGDREGLCAAGDESDERVVAERLIESSYCFAWDPQRSGQCPLDEQATVETSRGNFAGSYPQVFYTVLGALASPDIPMSTLVMRFFNAALFVGIVSAVIALLRPGQRGPVIWASLVTLVPRGIYIVPSVNPSSWAVLAGITVLLSTYGYFTAQSRGRRIALGSFAVVLGVMGAGARGDSAVYVAFAAFAAAILAYQKNRSWLRLALLPLAVIVIGAFFFLSAGQSTGAVAEPLSQGAASDASASGGSGSSLGLLLSNIVDLPWLWTGGTGSWGLGWLDTPTPPAVSVFMSGAMVALLFWGLRTMNSRKGFVLILGLLALAVFPLYVLQGKGLRVGEWVQPRYLLPLLLIVVGIALFGFAKDHLGISRLQATVLFAGIAIANSLSLHNNMRRYITGLGKGDGFNLNANIEWWWAMPIQPMTVWFIGSAAFALMLVGLFLHLYPKGERPSAPLAERAAYAGSTA